MRRQRKRIAGQLGISDATLPELRHALARTYDRLVTVGNTMDRTPDPLPPRALYTRYNKLDTRLRRGVAGARLLYPGKPWDVYLDQARGMSPKSVEQLKAAGSPTAGDPALEAVG